MDLVISSWALKCKLESNLDIVTPRLDSSGNELTQLLQENNVLTPSVQGTWHPFLNRPPEVNGIELPCEERSVFVSPLPSATEQLVQMVKKHQFTAGPPTNTAQANA